MTDHITAVHTPKGNNLRLFTRPETNDEALVHGILGGDEYRLKELGTLTGWALDIGAHIGTVGLALALDHPDLNVVMVEPVPDNADLIRRSIAINDLAARCHVIEAMAGKGEGTATCRYAYTHLEGFEDQGYVQQNAYIGGIWRLTDGEKVTSKAIEVPIVDRSELVQIYESGPWVFVKTDCEGCEWDFLDGARPQHMPLIVGEWHDNPIEQMRKMLPGHVIEVLDDYGGSGIFRATAK